MKSTLNIFVLGCLLVSTALANVTLYKCLEGGDICFSKSCCEETAKASSCCSEHPVEVSFEETCCDEVAIVVDTVFKDCSKTKIKIVPKSFDFDFFTHFSHAQKNLVNNDIIRGPPLGSDIPYLTSTQVYLKNCSFLC